MSTSAQPRITIPANSAGMRRWGRSVAKQFAATQAAAKAKAAAGKKKKKQQRRAVQTGRVAATRVGLSLSPLVRSLVPAIEHQGDAFPMFGKVVKAVDITTTQRTIVFVTNAGVTGTTLGIVQFLATGGTGVASTFRFTLPLLKLDDTAGGPTSMRAMKCGMTVTNRTQLLNRGAQCYFLNCQQRLRLPGLPTTMTASDWNTVFDALSTMPGCRDHDLAEYGTPRHYYCNVVDAPAYNRFDENAGEVVFDNFAQHFATWPTSSFHRVRPMSTLIFLVEPAAVLNSLNIAVDASYYTRWPLDTVPGQAQTEVPTTSPPASNKLHANAAEHASSGRGVSLDGLANLGGQMLSGYLEARRGRGRRIQDL